MQQTNATIIIYILYTCGLLLLCYWPLYELYVPLRRSCLYVMHCVLNAFAFVVAVTWIVCPLAAGQRVPLCSTFCSTFVWSLQHMQLSETCTLPDGFGNMFYSLVSLSPTESPTPVFGARVISMAKASGQTHSWDISKIEFIWFWSYLNSRLCFCFLVSLNFAVVGRDYVFQQGLM